MTEKLQSGYILLSRGLLDSNLWQLPPDNFRVAVYLLLKARHKLKPHILPDGLKIGRGELVTSMTLISENCSYYENRIVHEMSRKRALNIIINLENIGFLTRNSHSRGTHITICNYDTYQNPDSYNSHTVETQVKHGRNTGETPRDTNKKVNNENNEKNEKTTSSGKFSKPTLEEIREHINAEVQKGKPFVDPEQFYNHYESNGWKVGPNPMKSWKAAVVTWQKSRSSPRPQQSNHPTQMPKPAYVDKNDPHGLKARASKENPTP